MVTDGGVYGVWWQDVTWSVSVTSLKKINK